MAKNASTKTFDALTWTSDAQTSDDATAFRSARDWSAFALARAQRTAFWKTSLLQSALHSIFIEAHVRFSPAIRSSWSRTSCWKVFLGRRCGNTSNE